MKKIFCFTFLSSFLFINAQLKVGKNPTTINSNANLQIESNSGNQFIVTRDSSMIGIGTLSPTNPLHIVSSSNPLRIEGLQSGNLNTDSVMVSDANGVVKRISLSSGDDNSIGAISIFPFSAIPSGYLECNGQAVSRTTYAMLFSKIGTTYGAGNGSTTFNLPDLRGEFVRGWDNGKGVDASRTLGSSQVATSIAESIGIWTQTTGNVGASQVINDGEAKSLASGYSSFSNSTWPSTWSGTYFNQVRPRNVAMIYAIKAVPSINIVSGSGSNSSSTNTEPWYSASTNSGATLNTENIYQMGNVGINNSNPSSSLAINGSLATKYINVSSSNYNINNQDYYMMYSGTTNATFTLPIGTLGTCNCSGRTYEIINNSNNTINLDAFGSEMISGALNINIASNQVVKIVNTGSATGSTWQIINYGSRKSNSGLYEIASTAFNGIINTPQNIDGGDIQVNASSITLTVPSGYPSNRIVLRWDIWGHAGAVNDANPGRASLLFKVENVSNAIYSPVAYQSVFIPATNALYVHRWTAPIAYYLTNVAPGTYTFRLLANFIDNNNCNAMQVYGVSAQGSVYVQNP